MAAHSPEITISNVRLDLEELLDVIRRLDQPSRACIAKVLAEAEMDFRFKDLIGELAAKAPVDDITDADIDREVQAVRDAARPE